MSARICRRKIAGQLRSALFQSPQYRRDTSGGPRVVVNDEGKAVWSFFDEFEVDPENPFQNERRRLLSKYGKTFYRCPAEARATTLRVPETVETFASFSIDSKHLVKIVAPSVKVVKERAVEAWSVESIELSEKLEVVWTNSFLIRDAIDVGPVKIPNDAKVERAENACACARLERFNGEPFAP